MSAADPAASPGGEEENLDLTDDRETPGVIAVLGELGAGAVITEKGLARLFHRSPSTVKRAVSRGELPKPVTLFGQQSWTAGVLVEHLEKRQRLAEDAAAEARQKEADQEAEARRTELHLQA